MNTRTKLAALIGDSLMGLADFTADFSRSLPRVKPARKPLVGKGSKWHRRMVESGRKK